ncbi:sulfatase-like hydrolase/transferase [Ulvibacterium sp.]|uniref:sulfatase-like hydrolase/transferase n=1 Tax=Ulvibacterium sp. TaxID=2665914 RepID=UPI00262AF2CF|nr:sulfatase-like hydrolase/transferase [Ulvibacterium sp.]
MRILLFIVVCITATISCKKEKKEPVESPNILWISAEDISPAWGCYGDSRATTPNIDKLAGQGYIFTQAFSNAPICAPARATLITGMYATSTGTQNLRSAIPMPKDLKILPQLLSEKGYFTSNNAKTDYNFSPDGKWDELGSEANWRNRKPGQPFFSVFNFGITHEGHANRYNPEDTKSLVKKHVPGDMIVPPYFPDTEEFRKILAHQYDLISVFDQEVGKLITQLKEDGLFENTIVFIFSDHGFGLPRYKRWLYDTGLRVPFVLHAPGKYKHLVSNLNPGNVDTMVGFVDFAPTVLGLAGADVPEIMEGRNFLAPNAQAKTEIFGYRDRADDVFDVSRSVFDGRHLYIRNYLPHKPYIQNARIFNEGKRSYDELFRMKNLGELSEESLKMFFPKAPEELYDLQQDPNELHNLIGETQYEEVKNILYKKVKDHIIKTSDTGFMAEGQMMISGENSSVYQMARDTSQYRPGYVLEVAELVGKIQDLNTLDKYIHDRDPSVRFWALNAIDAFEGNISSQRENLLIALNDASPPNRGLAAEILINKLNRPKEALQVLGDLLQNPENEVVLLHTAVNVRNLGEKATPLLPIIKEKVFPKIAGDVWGRYKNWSYPMFIGMALNQTLINCGETIE